MEAEETVIIKMRGRAWEREGVGAKKFASPLLLQHFVAQGGGADLCETLRKVKFISSSVQG